MAAQMETTDFSSFLSDSLTSVFSLLSKDTITTVKDEQLEAVTSICCAKDTVCILPTGYGKSMIFFCLTPLYHHLKCHPHFKLKSTESPLIIVISPLLSLMKTHVKEAHDLHLSALQLPLDVCDADKIATADLLLASPEYWTSRSGLNLLQTVSPRVIALVTDEAHVAPKW